MMSPESAYVKVALVSDELSVVQLVLSTLRCNVYVYEPGAGDPSEEGTVQFNVTAPLAANATKLVGALAVVVTVC